MIDKFKRVYVVCDPLSDHKPESNIWTLSQDPNETGWETDTGYSGYGLPKALADFYATVINNHIEFRERAFPGTLPEDHELIQIDREPKTWWKTKELKEDDKE